uniref:Rad50/SbcC-type AAA domain-containing protein n=1 Tax=Desulfovibrio sp. U5L TaxID=596152 RepID=I2Q676_9BACT
MITRLTLLDFMAHARTVFDLAPGLNVLTGPNNTGKSAVVEALRCLARNPPPKHVIRHGATEARVTAETDDGTTVTWVRRPKYALYELTRPGAAEPEVFAKFGRTPPEEVLAVLGLGPVPIEGGDEVDVHIGNQREPVFLLDKPGSVLAGFFAASTEAAHLIGMQTRLTDRTKKAKAEKKRLDGRMAGLLAELDKLSALPDLELRLGAATDLEAELLAGDRQAAGLAAVLAAGHGLRGRVAGLGRSRDALAGLAGPPELAPTAALAGAVSRQAALDVRLDRTVGRRQALASLTGPPALADAARLFSQSDGLARLRAAEARAAGRATALDPLAPPPVLADLAGPADLARRLDEARLAAGRLAGRDRTLDKLAAPPEAVPVAPLAALAGRLEAGRAAKNALARQNRTLAGLAPPPVPADVHPLAATLAALAEARQAVAAAAAAAARSAAILAALAGRIEARLAQLPACPLCGGELSAADFLGPGHRHATPLPGTEKTP